jgi:hypothetical protein
MALVSNKDLRVYGQNVNHQATHLPFVNDLCSPGQGLPSPSLPGFISFL